MIEESKSAIQEAAEVAGESGQRARDYGHPFINHLRIARFWAAYNANKPDPTAPDTPVDVAWKMVLLKIARQQNTPKHDNLVDTHGYTLCAEEIIKWMETHKFTNEQITRALQDSVLNDTNGESGSSEWNYEEEHPDLIYSDPGTESPVQGRV